MSHKITSKEPLQNPCCCKTHDVLPSKLDLVIAQYEAMKKEAEEARDKFLQEALDFDIHECSKKQVEQLFDGLMWDEDNMWCPSLDVDDDDNVRLNIVVDNDGNAYFVDD